ncbi:MAG: ribbon-helix-helix protein, CopG family [Acidobacteriota bacterium]
MGTVQVVLGQRLLREADQAARRIKVNRSALVRAALRDYLDQLQIREREARDRRGYEQAPDREFRAWDGVAAWPDE